MTTPAPFRQFLAETVSQNTSGRKLEMTDEQLANAQQRHLKFMDDRNIDIQLIGPRPIAMWHWMRPFLQEYWCRVTNDVIARIVKLHPDRFRGMAQLPQSKEKDTRSCIAELERCIKDLGFVGAYLNPDPAGDKNLPVTQQHHGGVETAGGHGISGGGESSVGRDVDLTSIAAGAQTSGD